MIRLDSREANQLRALGRETGLVEKADGSCKFTQGNIATNTVQ